MNSAKSIEIELVHHSNPKLAVLLQRFFKTGSGEYAEGDRFLGIKVPITRSVVKKYLRNATIEDASTLLNSKWHECRFAGAVLLRHFYLTGTKEDKKIVYRTYLTHPGLNNWDLIDFSAPRIVGNHLLKSSTEPLKKLARSRNLWKRRIAIVSTLMMIANKRFEPTIELTKLLMKDPHDLIHKACGWALREIGNNDRKKLESFLDEYASAMPRTMLRYAIEKLPEQKRKGYLKQKPKRT